LAATGVAVPDILVKIYDLFAAGNAAGASEMYDRYASYIRYEGQVGVERAGILETRRGI
jgi:hypothetical protein